MFEFKIRIYLTYKFYEYRSTINFVVSYSKLLFSNQYSATFENSIMFYITEFIDQIALS